ncbi:hypothetical protein ALC53_04693 [Atta colombica]|uniref:Uncharacterized protein n=1 Tax=Atta colombica TaxID=520822 RepID=A0A195BL62_9HYME|nr:hypothetical protein ALC53_04693 [Atta colombica]
MDLCQLRREAAATNFTRVPSEEAKAMEVEEREERDTPVDIHKLAKLRELRFCSKSLLEGASASASRTAMVLEKYRRVFLVLLRDCQRKSSVYFIYERQICDRETLQKIMMNLYRIALYII